MKNVEELSFKNDQKIKDALVIRMDHHIEMDELMQGETGSGGKGCTVWCALNNGDLRKGYDHSAFPEVLGLPEWLARLHDAIYEGLTIEDSKWFSREWVRSIPVGVGLESVKWIFATFILKENIDRVLALKLPEELKTQVVNAIRGSLAVNESAIKTGIWDESAARSAARSAESAARSAESAARSAAARSARSAARSAESAARSAASATRSAAARSARSARSAESAAASARSAAESAAASARSAARSARSAESAAASARSAAYKKYAVELLRLFTELSA